MCGNRGIDLSGVTPAHHPSPVPRVAPVSPGQSLSVLVSELQIALRTAPTGHLSTVATGG